MPITRSTRPRSEAKHALIRKYLNQPGITQRDFCRKHGIAYSTFQLYLSKYRRQQIDHPKPATSPGRFVPLTLPGITISAGNQFPCELIWPNGMTIRFREIPSPEYLMALIKAGQAGL